MRGPREVRRGSEVEWEGGVEVKVLQSSWWRGKIFGMRTRDESWRREHLRVMAGMERAI